MEEVQIGHGQDGMSNSICLDFTTGLVVFIAFLRGSPWIISHYVPVVHFLFPQLKTNIGTRAFLLHDLLTSLPIPRNLDDI